MVKKRAGKKSSNGGRADTRPVKDQKYLLFKYSTENIGDEVQSIAARRFLPEVSDLVDRDQKIDFSKTVGAPAKIIMNGWFTHKPENWPPQTKGIDPLLISMYIDQKNPKTVASFTSKESKAFFKTFGPVGARDKATQRFLQDNGIASYFSGCLTLTLTRDERFSRNDFVLLVDVSEKLEEKIRASTSRTVISVSVYRTPDLPRDDKFTLAEYYLYLYQSAHAVVTTRLHATLPSLAFGTPVALVKEEGKFESDRYEGLADLAHCFTEQDLIRNPQLYPVDRPPENKPDYKVIRADLIKRCLAFTGYQANRYITTDLTNIYQNPSFMRIVGKGSSATYREILRSGDVDWLNSTVSDLRHRIARAEKKYVDTRTRLEQTETMLEEIRNSTSWKITSLLRMIEERIKRLR